jgi:uncharacterized protein YkwD
LNLRTWVLTALLLVPPVVGLPACGGGGGGGNGGANCLPGPGPAYGTFAQNPTPGQAQFAADVLAIVNTERNNMGLAPVVGDGPAAKVAFDFAVDMVQRAFFDHLNPECEDPGVRLTRAGIGWSTYGENIAQGQTTPAQVMAAWMASAGHRANILNPAFQRLGVGVHDDGAGGPLTWVQVFFTP